MTAHHFAEPDASPSTVPGGVRRLLRGGTTGNARLTALVGLFLLVLLAVEGFTVLNVRALFIPHAFIGFLLIPPIGLKLASTGYRFIAYYAGNAQYRAAGPPSPVPRILAPLLIAATVLLFASGVILVVSPPGEEGAWRQMHSLSFFVWFWLMSAHVLTYTLRAVSLARSDGAARSVQRVAGVFDRRMLVAGSLLLGLILAIAFLPWDTTWANWLGTFQRDH
ncbi:MAG: hypothetical protein M3Z66_14240 [Chloroflexota bacterium]|nr:hypothetical protein [Chloroflexota bacterium]